MFSLAPLFEALRGLATANAQGEYYLTDLVSTYRRRKLGVETVVLEDPNEIRGINSRSELAEASRIVRQKKNEELMAAGVTIEDPATTYVDDDVVVGADTVIHPGVHLEGRTQIGQACEIHAGVRIVNSVLDDRVTVQNFCVINGGRLGSGVTVGPFVHIRPETELRESVHIGNFVELKKAILGKGTKAGHLVLSRRRGDRRRRQHRRRHHHLQLRRQEASTRRSSKTGRSSAATRSSWRRSPLAKAPMSAAARRSAKNVPAGALAVSAGKQRNLEGWVGSQAREGPKPKAQSRQSPK